MFGSPINRIGAAAFHRQRNRPKDDGDEHVYAREKSVYKRDDEADDRDIDDPPNERRIAPQSECKQKACKEAEKREQQNR